MIYSLDKVLETERFKSDALRARALTEIANAISALKQNNFNLYKKSVDKLISSIKSFTKKFSVYVEDVLKFAKVKKGTMMYEHGVSLGTAAKATGASKWNLMKAIGERHEKPWEPISIETRLKVIRSLFGK